MRKKLLMGVIVIAIVSYVLSMYYIMSNKRDKANGADQDNSFFSFLSKNDSKYDIEIFTIDPSEISAFAYMNTDGVVIEFNHVSDGWQLADDSKLALNQDTLNELVSTFCNLSAKEIVNDSSLADSFTDTHFEYYLNDGASNEIVITCTPKDGEDCYFVLNHDYSNIYVGSIKLTNASYYSISDLCTVEE